VIYGKHVYFFKCFSHRSRIRLMELLAAHGELSVRAITQALGDREDSTVSRHLNILKIHGLVSSRRQGQIKYYSLNSQKIRQGFDEFIEFLETAHKRKRLEPVGAKTA